MDGSESPESSINKETKAQASFASRFPKVEGLTNKQIKEFALLGEMGMDELIPSMYLKHFTRRDEHGNHEMPVIYKDHVNAHGFGCKYIDELRAKKGPAFAKAVKDHVTKAKYIQAQINDCCQIVRRSERQIGEVLNN